MITVPEATKKIIERSPYLSEAINKGLINYSSLARALRAELEKILLKPVSEASILMALRRLSYDLKKKTHKNIFSSAPDMIVRSNLIEFTLNNTETLRKKYQQLFAHYSEENKYFFTLTEGVFETTIVVSRDLEEKVQGALQQEKILSKISHLSSITIRLPKENISTPGIYYFLLKSLAWEEINIVEIVSTPMEISIILDDREVNHAFTILKSLFENN